VKNIKQKQGEEPLVDAFKDTIAQPELRPFVSVDLPLPTSIPVDYIPDASVRLELYRKLARITSEDGFDEIQEEFHDRFGNPPQDVLNLIWQTRIKLMAEQVGFYSIAVEGQQLVMRYPPLPKDIKHRNMISLEPTWRSGKNEYWPRFSMNGEEWKTYLVEALNILNKDGQK